MRIYISSQYRLEWRACITCRLFILQRTPLAENRQVLVKTFDSFRSGLIEFGELGHQAAAVRDAEQAIGKPPESKPKTTTFGDEQSNESLLRAQHVVHTVLANALHNYPILILILKVVHRGIPSFRVAAASDSSCASDSLRRPDCLELQSASSPRSTRRASSS